MNFNGVNIAQDVTDIPGEFAQDTNNAGLYDGIIGQLSTRKGFSVFNETAFNQVLNGVHLWSKHDGSRKFILTDDNGGISIVTAPYATEKITTYATDGDILELNTELALTLTSPTISDQDSSIFKDSFSYTPNLNGDDRSFLVEIPPVSFDSDALIDFRFGMIVDGACVYSIYTDRSLQFFPGLGNTDEITLTPTPGSMFVPLRVGDFALNGEEVTGICIELLSDATGWSGVVSVGPISKVIFVRDNT